MDDDTTDALLGKGVAGLEKETAADASRMENQHATQRPDLYY